MFVINTLRSCINLGQLKGLIISIFIALLVGCGATQTVVDGTSSTFNAIFYKQIKTLHLDFKARAAINTDEVDYSAVSQSVVVRIYQIKDHQNFDKAVYLDLLKSGDEILGEDLVASQDVLIKPEDSISFDMPMKDDAEYVAVVGLFRTPDTQTNSWKVLIPRQELDPDDARLINIIDNRLELQEVAK